MNKYFSILSSFLAWPVDLLIAKTDHRSVAQSAIIKWFGARVTFPKTQGANKK